ncbi:MAG: hypothetical protein FWF97_01470 [Alphaproteobacteria bacterium]|nr:hypothetical protein [Alphaproteobacteria bacterium]
MNNSEQFDWDTMVHKAPIECYVHDLAIPRAQFYSLNGKSVCLVGGGKSPVKKGLNENGIRNCTVTNIEPYLCHEAPTTQDLLIKQSLFEIDYWNHLEKFDEIWARFSLPLYTKKEEQKLLSFLIPAMMLKTGGTLRVIPVDDKELPAVKAMEGLGLRYSSQKIITMNPIIYDEKFNAFLEFFDMLDMPKPDNPSLKDVFNKKIPMPFLDTQQRLVLMQKTGSFNKFMVQKLIDGLKNR